TPGDVPVIFISGYPKALRPDTDQPTLPEKPFTLRTFLAVVRSAPNTGATVKAAPSDAEPISEPTADAEPDSPAGDTPTEESESCSLAPGIPYGKANARVSPGVFTSPDATKMYCLPSAM
ncbi:MAG: hypothetical protein VYE68_02510, partial [Acidobacteriota bacterium]|nr:hypothetical protein [Acidobacteriota bacterium]